MKREQFSARKYEDLSIAIKNRIDKMGTVQMTLKTIENLYLEYDSPSDINGYQVLDINKLETVMAFFAQSCKNLYKVKLMKLKIG